MGERLLDHAEPLVGVEEAVGPGEDPDMLGDGARRYAEKEQRAGTGIGRGDFRIIRRAPSASNSRRRSALQSTAVRKSTTEVPG